MGLKSVLVVFCVGILGIGELSAQNDYYDQDCRTHDKVLAGMHIPGCEGPIFFIAGAYTLWTAREDSLNAANAAYSPDSEPPADNIGYPQWKLRSGFKVAIGSYFGADGWEIMLQYTWFYNLHNGWRTTIYNTVLPTFAYAAMSPDQYIYQPTPPYDHSIQLLGYRTQWSNQFNRIDFVLARTVFVGHYFLMRPFIGLLAFWDYQKPQAVYHYSTEAGPTTVGPINCASSSQTAWGVGPYVGGGLEYCFYSDCLSQVGIFTDWGVALPWSTFKAKNRVEVNCENTATDTDLGINVLDSRNNFLTSTLMLEVILGIRWILWFGDGFSFTLQAAWENQWYSDHNHMYMFVSAPQGLGSSDYSMQGLTIKVVFGF